MTITDPEIINAKNSNASGALSRAALFGGLAGCVVVLMLVGDNQGWFLQFGLSEHTADLVMGIITGVLVGAALATFLKARFGRGTARNRIDEFQLQQRRILLAITTLVIGFGAMAILHPLHHSGPIETDFSVEFALLAIAVAAATTFGVGFLRQRCRAVSSDELMRALRARAVQVGYIISIFGLSTVYLVDLFKPGFVVVVLPVALLIGVLAPTLYFLIAERRASSDG